MKILITGGRGFTGEGLVKAFEGSDHKLRLMGRKHWESEHEVFAGDVSDYDSCREAVRGCDAILMSHMAVRQDGHYGEGESPKMAFDVNVTGTANLFYAAADEGIKKVCLISSIGVLMGYEKELFKTCDLPPKSNGLYGLTKVLQEHIAEQFHRTHDMQVSVLRVSYIMDGEKMEDKYGRQIKYHSSHLIDRSDIGRAARCAFELDDIGYEVFYPQAAEFAAERMETKTAFERLGWQPKYDFRDVERDPEHPTQ